MLGPDDRAGRVDDDAGAGTGRARHLRVDEEVGQLPRAAPQARWTHAIARAPAADRVGAGGTFDEELGLGGLRLSAPDDEVVVDALDPRSRDVDAARAARGREDERPGGVEVLGLEGGREQLERALGGGGAELLERLRGEPG